MKISAHVKNTGTSHDATVTTGSIKTSVLVELKAAGKGSSVNGGEFLMLAVATCYCNDIYREADRLGITVTSVEVEASGEFPALGLGASNITYQARIESPASQAEISRLLQETDAVAEVHNTIGAGSGAATLAKRVVVV